MPALTGNQVACVVGLASEESMRITPASALEFVRSAPLPAPRSTRAAAPKAAPFNFDQAKDQALVVGSDIISFAKGVTEERRADIANSALLAQLVANKRVPDPTELFAWYDAYFDTLTNIGWATQERQLVEYSDRAASFEAHKAILKVAASLLGGVATTAYQLVETTLNALQSMNQDNPFIQLFERTSQKANTARFQVSLASENPQDGFLVTLLAFALTAQDTLTQVLFFKFHREDINIKHASGKVSVNAAILASIRDALQAKLEGLARGYVAQLPDL
jgi:hypothetical protein